MKSATFDESISGLGAIGERIIARQYHMELVRFDNEPDAQRAGTDTRRGCLTHDVKARDPDTPKYWRNGPDILIETVSVREQNVPGWIYTSKADILFYGVLNHKKTDFDYLWRFRFDRLREWWQKQRLSDYHPKIAQTVDRNYTTESRVVPLRVIPAHIYTDERPHIHLMRNAVRAHNELMQEYQREVWACSAQLRELKNNNAGAKQSSINGPRSVSPHGPRVDPILKEALR